MKINMKELKSACANETIVTVCDSGVISRSDMLLNGPEDAFKKSFGSKNMVIKDTGKAL